jgi:hypothetical protein
MQARLENTRTASESWNGATPIADSSRNDAFQLRELKKHKIKQHGGKQVTLQNILRLIL